MFTDSVSLSKQGRFIRLFLGLLACLLLACLLACFQVPESGLPSTSVATRRDTEVAYIWLLAWFVGRNLRSLTLWWRRSKMHIIHYFVYVGVLQWWWQPLMCVCWNPSSTLCRPKWRTRGATWPGCSVPSHIWVNERWVSDIQTQWHIMTWLQWRRYDDVHTRRCSVSHLSERTVSEWYADTMMYNYIIIIIMYFI